MPWFNRSEFISHIDTQLMIIDQEVILASLTTKVSQIRLSRKLCPVSLYRRNRILCDVRVYSMMHGKQVMWLYPNCLKGRHCHGNLGCF